MPCFRCLSTGWESKTLVPFSHEKQVFVLIPCKMCAGNGKIDIKEWKQEKEDGGESRDVL